MPKIIAKKINIVDVKNEAVDENVEVNTNMEQINNDEEEVIVIQPIEPVLIKAKSMVKAKAKPKIVKKKEELIVEKEEPIKEELIKEELIKEVKQTKQEKAKYMRQYRKIASSTEQLLLNELNVLKEEKQKSIVSVKNSEPQIKKNESVVEKTLNYDNIPDEIIEKEIKKRISLKNQNRYAEKFKNLALNIA